MKDAKLEEQFEFRSVRTEETEEAAALEQKCFPPNEACAPQFMKERIQAAAEIFLVAVGAVTTVGHSYCIPCNNTVSPEQTVGISIGITFTLQCTK